MLREPLADIYLVESYKEHNYEFTDRTMGDESSMGLNMM